MFDCRVVKRQGCLSRHVSVQAICSQFKQLQHDENRGEGVLIAMKAYSYEEQRPYIGHLRKKLFIANPSHLCFLVTGNVHPGIVEWVLKLVYEARLGYIDTILCIIDDTQ